MATELIKKVDIPAYLSPFIRVICIGDDPLYFGNNDGWRFIDPYLGICIILVGRILYAITTNKSGLMLESLDTNLSLKSLVLKIFILNDFAIDATSVSNIFKPLPCFLSSFVTIKEGIILFVNNFPSSSLSTLISSKSLVF